MPCSENISFSSEMLALLWPGGRHQTKIIFKLKSPTTRWSIPSSMKISVAHISHGRYDKNAFKTTTVQINNFNCTVYCSLLYQQTVLISWKFEVLHV